MLKARAHVRLSDLIEKTSTERTFFPSLLCMLTLNVLNVLSKSVLIENLTLNRMQNCRYDCARRALQQIVICGSLSEITMAYSSKFFVHLIIL